MSTFLFILWACMIFGSPFVGSYLGKMRYFYGKRWAPYAMIGWVVLMLIVVALLAVNLLNHH